MFGSSYLNHIDMSSWLGSWYEHPLQSICILQHSPISMWFYPCSYICSCLKMPKKSQINEYSDITYYHQTMGNPTVGNPLFGLGLAQLKNSRSLIQHPRSRMALVLEMGAVLKTLPKNVVRLWRIAVNVQDWSLRCPSNAIWPFKTYLSQNNPSTCNPKSKMMTSLEVPDIICPSSTVHMKLISEC